MITLTAFVMIPGAGGVAWYWHRVSPLLREAGHQAIAVDLPGDDPKAGLPEYARIVEAAIGGRRDVTLVAMSLGGFTAPLAARSATAIVLVNAMIPCPGETASDWWANTGAAEARTKAAQEAGYSAEFDLETYFLHDVPADVAAAGERHQRNEADAAFESPCDFPAWPEVPLKVVAGNDDRFFPVEFQRRIARERLGLTPDVLPGGHLMALAHPEPLARYLLSAA